MEKRRSVQVQLLQPKTPNQIASQPTLINPTKLKIKAQINDLQIFFSATFCPQVSTMPSQRKTRLALFWFPLSLMMKINHFIATPSLLLRQIQSKEKVGRMNQALFGCAGGTGQVEGGPKVHLRQSSAAKSSHPAPKSQTYMCAQNTSYTPIHTNTFYVHIKVLFFTIILSQDTQQSTTQHHWNANKTKEHNNIAQTVHNESSHPNVKSPTYMCAQTPKPSPSLRAILMRDFTDTMMINLFQSNFFQTSSYHMCKKLQTSDITISSPLLSLSLALLSDSLYCFHGLGCKRPMSCKVYCVSTQTAIDPVSHVSHNVLPEQHRVMFTKLVNFLLTAECMHFKLCAVYPMCPEV